MIGKCAGHEFDLRPGERPGNIAVVPAAVESNLAHRKLRRKGVGILIHHGFKAQLPADFRGGPDPVVTYFVVRIGGAAQIEVGAAPQPVGLGLDRLVHQTARNEGAGSIQPGDHQQAVGGIEPGGVGGAVQRIRQRSGQRQMLLDARQQRQFGVHRRFVPAHFRAGGFVRTFRAVGFAGDAHRHPVTQHEVADFRLLHLPEHPPRLAVRGVTISEPICQSFFCSNILARGFCSESWNSRREISCDTGRGKPKI